MEHGALGMIGEPWTRTRYRMSGALPATDGNPGPEPRGVSRSYRLEPVLTPISTGSVCPGHVQPGPPGGCFVLKSIKLHVQVFLVYLLISHVFMNMLFKLLNHLLLLNVFNNTLFGWILQVDMIDNLSPFDSIIFKFKLIWTYIRQVITTK